MRPHTDDEHATVLNMRRGRRSRGAFGQGGDARGEGYSHFLLSAPPVELTNVITPYT